MKKYEIGTPQFKDFSDCLDCALRIAGEYKKQGFKVYVRDTYKNVLVYDAYFNQMKGGLKNE